MSPVAMLVAVLAVIVGAGGGYLGGEYVGDKRAKLEAKAKERDAIAAAVAEANKQAKADHEAALRAERNRASARVAAAARSAGLRESIRTEYVYRNTDCTLPAADLVRINEAIAGSGGAPAPGRRDGVVRDGATIGNRELRRDGGQAVDAGRAVE